MDKVEKVVADLEMLAAAVRAGSVGADKVEAAIREVFIGETVLKINRELIYAGTQSSFGYVR